MDFLDSILATARDTYQKWAAERAKTPTHTDAVERDSFDELDWENLRSEVPALAQNIDRLSTHYDYVAPFYEDFFNLLHQGDPMVRPEEEMVETHRPNRAMTTDFRDMPEVESLRLSTMHDQYATAMSMLSMQTTLEDAYQRSRQAQEDARKALEQREQAEQAMKVLANAMSAAEGLDPEDEEAAQDAAQAIEDALKEAEAAGIALLDAEDKATASARQGAREARNTIRKAAAQAADERSEEEQLMAAFGVEDGALQRMSFEERRRLAERLKNNRLAKFAKLLGQFAMLQSAESRRKVIHSPDEVVGIELGDDLQRITVGELSNLAEPLLEDDFWRRWADKQLLQYRLEGTEKMGRGPIIVVCDESGSMSGAYGGGIDLAGGTPEAWSKALSLALCEQARQGNRDFIYIGFSSANQQYMVKFEGGHRSLEKVIGFTEHFFGGGTYYEKPLRMALQIVQEYGAQDKPKPDVVFITDDEYRIPDKEFLREWQEARRELSMIVYGVVIGRPASGALDAISDNVRSVTELSSDPGIMRDVFQTI